MVRKSGPKGGRPEYQPTPGQKRRVEEMRTIGISEEEVAAALEMSRTTLRKHFAPQLMAGRSKRRAEINELMWREARKGKGWAIKELSRLSAAASAEDSFMSDEPAPKLGKKEQANLAAQTVGANSEWGDDLMLPGARPN